jgi:hypothetical protein
MKTMFVAAAAICMATTSAQAADVGVSIGISQPGVYGRIDIGRFPQPAVVVAQPVIIAPPRVVAVPAQPVYMWVPPGHQKNWAKHCGRYNACGVPVYFVQDAWYEQHVRYADEDRGKGKGHGKGNGKGKY